MGRYCPNPDCPELTESDHPSEYRNDVLACPSCNTELVEQVEPPTHEVLHPDFQSFVPVRSLANHALIPVAKSILDAAGIRYFVRNEQLGSMIPLPVIGVFSPHRFPEITVEPERAEEARELLADLG